VRTDGHERQDQILFPEDKIVAYEKQENVQDRVGSTAGGIPERELVHHLTERRIEKINKLFDRLLHALVLRP
jgi:hypothetical protein